MTLTAIIQDDLGSGGRQICQTDPTYEKPQKHILAKIEAIKIKD